ncbi:MAG: POTRA domain-containing protein [Candidatus Aerophobetes bacterium]|nr:POTRA domain-containing protein [Candidatus Aerophobetes bacterium]
MREIGKLKIFVLLFALGLILNGSSLALGLTSEEQLITDIIIEGNVVTPENLILSEIKSRRGQKFDPERLETDLKFIYSLGYFSDVQVVVQEKKEGVRLVIELDEFPVIRKVIFEGNTICSFEEMIRIMNNRAGRLLNIVSLKEDTDAISSLYHRKGYTMAKVSDTSLTSNNELTIIIDEGWLRRIEVAGNLSIKKKVIVREFEPYLNEVYNTSNIRKALFRLKELSLFKNIEAEASPIPGKEGILLRITVEEKNSFSSFSSRMYYNLADGYAHEFCLERKTLNAHNIQLLAKIGRDSAYKLSFHNPYLGNKLTGFNFNIYKTSEKKGTLHSFKDEREGILLSIKERFNEDSPRVSLKKEEISFSRMDSNEKESSHALSIIVELEKDNRDNFIFPSSGSRFHLSFQGTAIHSYENNQFGKMSFKISRYQRIEKKSTLAGSLEAHLSSGNIPQYEWFYPKEDSIIHGYKRYDLWGEQLAVFTLEIRRPIRPFLQGVFSLNIGDTWGNKEDDSLSHPLKVGIGVGLNYLFFNTYRLHLSYGVSIEGRSAWYASIKPILDRH